jgi:N-acetylglucosaminyl-diphospho-decaprenol L-rhamnosyltransferase
MCLSILIVNWNSKDYIKKCLQSIESTKGSLVIQIIVVDAGSFDGCGEMLLQEFPFVEFIQSKKNIGFGPSNNLAAEHIRHDTVLLLNPDTELKKHALQDLVKAHSEISDVGIIGAKLYNSDGTLQLSSVQAAPSPINQTLGSEFLMTRFPKFWLWKTYNAYTSNRPTEVEAVSGACMLLSTQLYRNVGGFTPSFFMYAEDMDLCFKVRKMGYKIYFIPTAQIVHHGGGSSSKQLSNFSNINMRNAIYNYMDINHGLLYAKTYKLLMFSSAILRIIFVFIATPFIPSEHMKRQKAIYKKWKTILRWSWANTPPEKSNHLKS